MHSENTEGGDDRAGGWGGGTEGTDASGPTQALYVYMHRDDLEKWKHLSKIEKEANLSFFQRQHQEMTP